ncbi:MAG: hypothetical protein WCE94_14485, partial [Candidatus Methanoperedens sp.]
MSEAVRASVKTPDTKKENQVSQAKKGNFYQPRSLPVEQITLPSNGDPYKSQRNPDGYLENRHGNNNRRNRKPEKCLEENI